MAQVTPLFICGGECGVNAIGVTQPATTLRHWSALGAGFSLSTAATRGIWSTRSLRFNLASAGVTDNATHTFAAAIASGGTMVARFYFRIDVFPSAVPHTLFSDIGGGCGLRLNAAFGIGFIEAWAGTAAPTTGAGSPTIFADSSWHYIDVTMTRGTTHSIQWALDGVDMGTITKGGQTASTITGFVLASNATGGGGNTAAALDIFIDDLCVSGTAGDYPIGPGKVEGLWPSADGAHSFTTNDFAWPTAAGTKASTATDAWTALHNDAEGLTSTISDFISQVVIRTTGYVAINFDDLSLSSINGLAVVSEHHGSTTGAHTQSLRLINAANTESAVFALVDYSDLTVAYNYKIYAVSPYTSAAWTGTEVDGLGVRWGFSGDVTGNPIFDGVMFEVDYAASLALPRKDRLIVPRLGPDVGW